MNQVNRNPLIAAGILMGVGLGGFIDGILLHQIFQVHSMLSAKLSQDVLINLKTSMVWDGLFHLFTWLSTAGAVYMLWHAGPQKGTGKAYLGAILVGWGIFNVVEGLIDHHLLRLHHVIERLGLSIYDYLFLAFGVLCVMAGRLLMRDFVYPKNLFKS